MSKARPAPGLNADLWDPVRRIPSSGPAGYPPHSGDQSGAHLHTGGHGAPAEVSQALLLGKGSLGNVHSLPTEKPLPSGTPAPVLGPKKQSVRLTEQRPQEKAEEEEGEWRGEWKLHVPSLRALVDH